MSDPTLKRSSVHIVYTASDGYRKSVCYSNIGRMGVKPPPGKPLIEAIAELSRLAELFGMGAEARKAFEESQAAVVAWRAERGSR